MCSVFEISYCRFGSVEWFRHSPKWWKQFKESLLFGFFSLPRPTCTYLVCFISGVYSVLVYFYLFPLSILVLNSTHVHGSKVPLSHIHTHQMRFKAIFILLLGLHTVHSFTIKFWIIFTVVVHSSIRFAEFFHWMYNLVRWICEKAI